MASALCKSPSIDPRFACFRLSIRASGIHGRGVFAAEPIPPRRKVIEYTGERIGRRGPSAAGMAGSRICSRSTTIGPWMARWAGAAEIINDCCVPILSGCIIRRGHIAVY